VTLTSFLQDVTFDAFSNDLKKIYNNKDLNKEQIFENILMIPTDINAQRVNKKVSKMIKNEISVVYTLDADIPAPIPRFVDSVDHLEGMVEVKVTTSILNMDSILIVSILGGAFLIIIIVLIVFLVIKTHDRRLMLDGVR
jgi:peroxiredoxin